MQLCAKVERVALNALAETTAALPPEILRLRQNFRHRLRRSRSTRVKVERVGRQLWPGYVRRKRTDRINRRR